MQIDIPRGETGTFRDYSKAGACNSNVPGINDTESDKYEPQGSGGGSVTNDFSPVKPHKKWLFMNYMAADCNLKKYQIKNLDQQELIGSDKNTHIVAFVDVGPDGAPVEFGEKANADGKICEEKTWNGAKLFYLNKDEEEGKLNPEVISDYGKDVDMSNYKTLKNAVVEMVKKFPADNVALIMNSHGGGFAGAMTDDSNGKPLMPLSDLGLALKEAQKETGKKIDIIGFDACLMAESEVAYELKDCGSILLGSEESEIGPGWDYENTLENSNFNTAIYKAQDFMYKKINVTPEEFAKVAVETNYDNNFNIPTFSAINLGSSNKLKNSINNLAEAIINTNEKEQVRTAIKESEHFGDDMFPYRDIRDLSNLAKNLIYRCSDPEIEKAAKGIHETLEEVVIANEVNSWIHPDSGGISIYAPINGHMGVQYGDNLSFVKDTKWYQALESLVKIPGQDKLFQNLP